jgi:hypothetical protein
VFDDVPCNKLNCTSQEEPHVLSPLSLVSLVECRGGVNVVPQSPHFIEACDKYFSVLLRDIVKLQVY